jgi:hypothetical protein
MRAVSSGMTVRRRLTTSDTRRVDTDDAGRLARSAMRRRMSELSRRLDRWDPIGIYAYDDQPPAGEYDFLLGPAVGALRNGAPTQEIADMLARELADHFGLSPAPAPLEFAAETRSWWNDEVEDSERFGG